MSTDSSQRSFLQYFFSGGIAAAIAQTIFTPIRNIAKHSAIAEDRHLLKNTLLAGHLRKVRHLLWVGKRDALNS